MRTETAARLKVLEEQYWGKVDNQEVGPRIREKYKQYGTDPVAPSPTKGGSQKESGGGILKKGGTESLAKPKTPKFDYRNLKNADDGDKAEGRGRSRSKSKKKSKKALQESGSPEPVFTDARQQIYEAKFEKFLANKKVKADLENRKSMSLKEDFDIYTKGPGSPSKKTNRFKTFIDPSAPKLSGKYNPDDLIPNEMDQSILLKSEMRQRKESGGDPFHNLGVSGADKMTFFLLKWVFNAIKRDSAADDPKF